MELEFPPCFALGFLQRPQKVLTVLDGLSLLRICILSGTRLLILFVQKLLMNWSFSKPRVWSFFFRLSIHKISLNVLFVTQVQVIIHRLLTRHPLRFCQRSLHDFQIRCNLHDTGLTLMDELKDAVHVPLDKVDIPRSAVSAIGIGSVTRRREKCQLCPPSLRSNHQELSPMTRLWPCLHDHCRASQVCLLGWPRRAVVQVVNQVWMLQVPGTLPNVASDKLSLCQVKLPSHRLVIWRIFRYRKVGWEMVLILHLWLRTQLSPWTLRWPPRTLATCPWLTFAWRSHIMWVCWHHQNLFSEIGFQWSQFSTMATAMSLSSWIFVVRRLSCGSPVEPCLMSRSGTCQLKEPFWPCRRRFVDSLLLVQVRFLPRMWREREWPAHHWHKVGYQRERGSSGGCARQNRCQRLCKWSVCQKYGHL